MSTLVLSLLLALEIQAPGKCPDAANIDLRLATLLPPGFQAENTDVATIQESSDGTVAVSLFRPDGMVIAHRKLPRAATCSDQAETVAATLAAWEAQIHPEISLHLDHISPLSVPAPAREGPAPPSPDRLLLQAEVAEPRLPPDGIAIGLGAGFAGGWQAGSVAPSVAPSVVPGGRLDMMVGRTSSPWRGRLSMTGLGSRSASLPPGKAHWWRAYLALGVDRAIPLAGRWTLVAGGAAVLGVATVDGSGYPINQRSRSADFGGEVLLRAEWRVARFRPWVALAVVTWLRRQDLEVIGADTAVTLPRVEPSLAIGADYHWRP